MKNLKKLISVIIAVIMLVSSFATVSAADYADVESTDSYYKAIKVLSGLGIAKGDDEGNFNPENDVKRSEMVAFVCRMMGEEDIATASSASAFSDVADDHWAAGYIAWGVNRGIINGMGDGTFAPDASVTYQDAVVMLMRALGYDRIAQRSENGGYPTGYLKLASQNSVLKDAAYDNAKAATREIIAQLVYNSLTAPLVDVSDYGATADDDKYVIYNGKGGNDLRTLLRFTNDIVKVKAEITQTPKANPAQCIDKAGNYMVEIDVKDGYEYGLSSVKQALGINTGSKAYVYAGETEATELLGSTVEAYLVDDEELGDWTLLAVIGDNRSVVEETITENLNTIVYDTANNVVKYYASLDDRKMTEIDVVASPVFYYNGVIVSNSEITSAFTSKENLLKNVADEITFMGSKNSDYDKIFVTDYTYKVVKSVNEAEKLIKFDPAGALDLDAESRNDEDFIYSIYDANGNAIDIADIAEGDVLNIVCPLDAGFVGQLDTVEYMDIYVTNEVITGKVDELKTTTGQYVIDGDAYSSEVTLTIGEEGDFYLSIDGKIVKKDASSAITKNFALFLGSDNKVSFGVNTYTFRLFTAEGEIDAKLADTLKVIDGAGNPQILKAKDGAQTAFVNSLTAAAANQNSADDAKDKVAERFFTYKTNTAGEITEIRFAGGASSELIACMKKTAASYDAEFNEFEGYAVLEDTPLFVAPVREISAGAFNVDDDKLTLANFSALDEKDNFYSYLYTVNGEDDLAAVLMTERPSYGLETSPFAVVAAIGTKLDADDNSVTSYTIVQSGETKVVVKDYDIDAADDVALAVGDIFQYSVNADDEINEIGLVYDASARALSATYAAARADVDDYAVVFGAISEYSDYIILMDDTDAVQVAPCAHSHDVACGYVAAVPEVPCTHAHDAACGYAAEVPCDAADPATCDHSACAYTAEVPCTHAHDAACGYAAAVPETPCTHSHDAACGYVATASAGTGKAANSIKLKVAEVEGATYAWYEEAIINNPVKKITINGIRETVRANAVYAAVAYVNENDRVEDIVVIALNPSDFNGWDDIDTFANWDLAY